jgi:hypothetical protein
MSQSTGSYGAFPPSSIVSTLEAKRNCKCYSGSRFIDVVTIGQRVANAISKESLSLTCQISPTSPENVSRRTAGAVPDRPPCDDPPTDIAECDLCLKL